MGSELEPRADLTSFGFELQNYDARYGYTRRYERRESDFSVQVEEFLADTLRETNLFRGVYEAPGKLDEEQKMDIFLELPSGRIIALDGTFTKDSGRMQEKALEIRRMEMPIEDLGRYGRIPLIPINVDWQKYEKAIRREIPVPREAQSEMIDLLIKMLNLKLQERIKTETEESKKRKIQQFYEDYLNELEELRKKMG